MLMQPSVELMRVKAGPAYARCVHEAPTRSSDVLEVTDLAIRFGRTTIFSGLSFTVPKGAALAIVGPNGSGKTVLLRALIGAIPFEGTVRWALDVRLGYVPQKLDIARGAPITGFDFLQARIALSRTSKPNVPDVLATVGLTAAAGNCPIGTLSGGQFQRLLIAFALVGTPNVLLLDEPTAGIDEPGQERLNELLHRLQQDRGLTVMLISHDLSVVYRHATTVLCLGRERHWFGPPKEILTPELLHEVYGTPVAFHVHEP
jgi:zinc transport system ATP-binding protein